MPTLKHLLDELRKLRIDPDEIKMPGPMYDDFVSQAEDVVDNPDENPDDR